MEYVTVGTTKVPKLGLGTARLRGGDCLEGVGHALAIGYRAIDTAQRYENETEVGQAVAASPVRREEVFLTTKVDHWTAPDVTRSMQESLRKLRTDYVDLLLIHWPSTDVPLAETLDAMVALCDAGHVRAIGVSNFPPSLYREAIGLAPIITNQVEYHPYLSQRTLLDITEEHGLMLTSFSPLGRGVVLDDPVLVAVAAAHGKGTDQVALRWLVQQPRVSTNPKSSDPERRRRNLDVFDFELSEEEMQRIHALDRGERVIDPPFAPDWERTR